MPFFTWPRPEKSLADEIPSKIALHAMRPACPQSNHRGVTPVCHQDRRKNGTSTSAHILAHETQHMFASQPPWDHRVGYHPSYGQHCIAQAPQNFPALHNRVDVHTSSPTCRFQHAVPTGDNLSLPNNCQQMSREDNQEFSSSVNSPAQCRRRFVGTANEHASGQSVVQFNPSSRKISNGCVSINSGECSNTNNARLAQTHINPALSEKFSSAGLKGFSHHSTSGMHPQHGSTNISCTWPNYGPEQSLLESQSLLRPSTQTLSHTPAISALVSLAQAPFSNSHEQQRSSLSHISWPVLTDDKILDFIKKRIAYYKSRIKRSNGGPEGQNFCFNEQHFTLGPQNQSDCRSIMPRADSVAHPPATFDHLEKTQGYSDTGFKQFFTYGDEAYEEDKSKKRRANAESPLKLKTKNGCDRSTPEKDSSGTPVSAVENSNDAYKNKSVEKSASLDFELPGKKQLDVTVSADSDDKLIYSSDSSQDKRVIIDDEFYTKWHNKALKNDLSTLPALHYSLNALKELMTSLESINTIAEKDNVSDTILQQYWNGNIDNVRVFTSTEYRQIMMSVAATCTKTEEENPVVLTAVSGRTLAELVEKQPTSKSQEEYKSVWLNVNKSLDDIDKEPGVSSSLKHRPDKEEGTRGPKPVKAVEFTLTSTDLSKGLKAKSSSVLSENKTTEHASVTGKRGLDHKKVIPPSLENQIHNPVSLSKNLSVRRCKKTKQATQNDDVMEDADSVYSQAVLSTALSENKCEQVPLSRGSANLKDPQYDDITDDESPPIENMNVDSELSTHSSDNKDSCLQSFSEFCKVPQYEDITDDESSQIQDVTVVPQAVTLLSASNTDKSPCGNQNAVSVGELIPKEKVIQRTETYESVQVCSCPYYIETDDGFEEKICPKCETERQLEQKTNLRSSMQSKVHGGSLVIIPDSPPTSAPLSNGSLSSDEEGRMEAPKESASPTVAGLQNISVTEMKTSQYEVITKKDGVQCQKVTEPNNIQKLKEPHREEVTVVASPQNEDLAEDYFQCESEMDDEMEDPWMVIPVTISDLKFEPAHVNHGSLDNLPQHGETGEKTIQGGKILTGSELHQSASKPAPATTTISTTTATLEVFETLDSFLKAKTVQLRNSFNHPMSAESEKGHSQSKDQEAVTKTEKSTPSLEFDPKSELSTHWSRRQSSSCETEDSSDYSVASLEHNHMTVSRKCLGKRLRPKTHVRALSFEDTCAPKSESETADGKFTDVKKQTNKIISTCETDSSDDSECVRKSTHFIKSKAGSDRIRRKTKRRKSSKKTLDSDTESENDQNSRKKAKIKRLFSGSGDSSDDLFRPQNQHSPETVDYQWPTAVTEQKPKQTGPSEELTPTQQQSVNRVESLSTPAPVIPRLVVQVPSDPTDRQLKLSKQSAVHKQGKDESEELTPAQQQSVNRVESLSTPAPVIPRLVVQVPSDPTDRQLKLSKQSVVHKQGKDETLTKTNEKNKSSNKKHKSQLQRHKEKGLSNKKASSSRPHQKVKTSDNRAQNTAKNYKSSSKNHSSQDGPSTSRESLASIEGPFPTARDGSAFSRKSRECLSSSKHRRSVSKVQRSYSSERPSTSVHPPHPSAKQQVRNEWQNSFFPTRRDRKISQETEEDLKRTPACSKRLAAKQDYDAREEARLGPSHFDRQPRPRHNSYESVTPLMKKSISQAKMWTLARRQETPCQRRPSVGEGYKWGEKRPSARRMSSRAKRRKK